MSQSSNIFSGSKINNGRSRPLPRWRATRVATLYVLSAQEIPCNSLAPHSTVHRPHLLGKRYSGPLVFTGNTVGVFPRLARNIAGNRVGISLLRLDWILRDTRYRFGRGIRIKHRVETAYTALSAILIEGSNELDGQRIDGFVTHERE